MTVKDLLGNTDNYYEEDVQELQALLDQIDPSTATNILFMFYEQEHVEDIINSFSPNETTFIKKLCEFL